MSKYKLRLERQRRRERARSREATAQQPIAAQPTQSGVQVLGILAQRFDELFESKSPRDVLLRTLASKS